MGKKERRNFSISLSVLVELSVRLRFLLEKILLSEENTWVWACLSFPLTSLWDRLFSSFSKNGKILPEKPSPRLFKGEKDTSHPCESLLKRLGPPLVLLNPLCSSWGGKDIANGKHRSSSKPSQSGQQWISLSRGWDENPAPCSTTIQWDLGCGCLAAHSFAHAESCACWACLWGFLSVFGLNKKAGTKRRWKIWWETSRI